MLEAIRGKGLQSTVFEHFCACAMFEFATIISSLMDLRLILIIRSSQMGVSFETFSMQYLVRVLRVSINVATGDNRMHIKKWNENECISRVRKALQIFKEHFISKR